MQDCSQMDGVGVPLLDANSTTEYSELIMELHTEFGPLRE